MNQIIIEGNLGSDPEIKMLKDEVLASFSLAHTPRKKVNGQYEDGETIWFRVTFWNAKSDSVIENLRKGERIALVSDAGTPAISDPGARIVDAVIDAGLRIIPIAGASAGVAALSASGLMTDEFHFVGFLPSKASQRAQLLSGLLSTRATLVFYEAPHRILETAQALANALGGTRRVVVARELSKLFEQIHRCQLSELHHWLALAPEHQRGEFVLLVEAEVASDEPDLSEATRVLSILLESNSVSQAAALAARITGLKKNALYDLALKMQTTDE